jgi:sugar phosphate permease
MAAGGFAWLSQIPAEGQYWLHVFVPGCLIALALGLLFPPLASAATAGVSQDEAGLASGVLNTARQLGGSLGLAVLATVATDHTRGLLDGGHPAHLALSSGYGRAFAVALIVPNVGRTEPAPAPDPARAGDGTVRARITSALEPEPG